MVNNVKELAIQDDKNKILNLPKLPGHPILTTIITRNNAKIHLVGVFHYTKKSRGHVFNVIRQTKPNVLFGVPENGPERKMSQIVKTENVPAQSLGTVG